MIDANKRHKRKFKRILPQTLLGRSLLILVTPVLLIQVISTYVFFDRHWTRMTSRLAFSVAGEIAVLSEYVEKNGDSGEKLQNMFNLYESRLGLLVTFDEGRALILPVQQENKLLSGWAFMIKETLRQELDGVIIFPYTVDVDFNEKWVEVRVELSRGILNVSLSQRRLFSSTTYIFLLWVFAAAFVLLIIAILFMRNQIRPIKRLAIAAERFGRGQEVHSFKVEGAREVRLAGQAFLDMKTRIQRQISQRTDMLAGVSHDLRTPLTRLKLQIAMLGDSPDIYDMKKDIQDMEKMIEGYLSFVRGEGTELTTKVDVAALLQEITIATKRQGCDVALQLNEISVTMPMRQTAFKRCLSNLVNNATKYADFIWITLTRERDEEICIVIEDNGPGIDESKYEDVFRPFYRVDSSRNAETGGVGLGMPIAMDIVHSHGGEIWLQKSQHGGLAVHIRLPI